MKTLDLITKVLIIVGGLNWALHALNANLVDGIFGVDSMLSKVVYILVGLSAVYQIFTLKQTAKQYQPVKQY
ncbi:MAG TPA: DUF378 domain-containing protein [Ignavibacteriaceae bacterium]|nr:DUF378 domain-containing protein [Ignavibacteriaceae bacterium]